MRQTLCESVFLITIGGCKSHTHRTNSSISKIPYVSKRAFWDIDFHTNGWEHNTQYLIIKVDAGALSAKASLP
ncbi:hypothetical protein [Saccharicrinis carchari]|uniref:hypothetical protein n=1 Tax=Saccharicrinis carchari TaxID=1168039 RepID=UPI00115A0BA8|nr:hypothetical protein [Saccharicrinis carchari]